MAILVQKKHVFRITLIEVLPQSEQPVTLIQIFDLQMYDMIMGQLKFKLLLSTILLTSNAIDQPGAFPAGGQDFCSGHTLETGNCICDIGHMARVSNSTAKRFRCHVGRIGFKQNAIQRSVSNYLLNLRCILEGHNPCKPQPQGGKTLQQSLCQGVGACETVYMHRMFCR